MRRSFLAMNLSSEKEILVAGVAGGIAGCPCCLVSDLTKCFRCPEAKNENKKE